MNMNKKYKLEILDAKPNTIRVDQIFDEHWVNTFEDLADSDPIIDMHEWCQENECGWRTSYNTFKFRNKEQLLMFVMRWA